MGFFHKLQNKASDEQSTDFGSDYKKLVSLLVADEAVQKELDACINAPEQYFAGHAARYEERGLGDDVDADTIIWIGIVDALIDAGRVFEFDYSVELSDFIWGLEKILPDEALVIDEDWLEEEDDITVWTKLLTDQWREKGAVIAAMDIDSDSYVTFVCRQEVFEELVRMAARLGHRIAYAHEM